MKKIKYEINEISEYIFNIVREPLLVLDKDLRVVSVSQSFNNFFNISADQTIGNYIYDVGNHDWDFPKIKVLLEKILPEKKSVDSYEVEHDFTGIGNRVLILNARQIESTPEKEKIILIAIEDITDQRRSEKKIKVREVEFREIVEHSADAIFIVDYQGRYIYINTEATKMLGYSKEEMMLLTISDISPKNRLEEYSEILKKTVQEGSFFAEIQLLKKDGNLLSTDLNTALLPNELIYGSCRDITDRKIVEESLRESHQFIEEIINSIPVRVFWKDKNLNYLGCNNLFAQDAGFSSPKEIIGKDDFQMGWYDQAELYREDDRKVMESGESKLHIEEPQTTPEGKTITLLTSKIPLFDYIGKIIGVLGIYIDITERKQIESALKISEERFRTASGSLTDVVYDWDTNHKLDWYGDIDGITGYPPGGFPRTIEGWEALIHPEDKYRIITALENHIKGIAPYSTEYRIKRNDGVWRWWSARGTALRDDQGTAYKMIGSITDITEQKAVQHRIKFKSDLLSHIGQSVIATDLQGNVIYWNKGAEEIYGWSSDEAMGKNIVVLTPADQTVEQANEIMKELSGGNTWSGEFLVKRKDGSIFSAHVTDAPFMDSDGKLTGIIGISSDITERKHAEEEIQKGNEQFKLVWNGSIDGMRIMDENGTIILVNDAFCNMVGLTRIQLEGSHFSVLFDKSMNETSDLKDKNPKMEIYKLRFLENKIEPKFEREINLWDGRKVWFEVTNSNMEFAGGKSVLLSIFRDITERKQAESIIQEQNNRLQKLNATKDKFFSIIGHDLKSPFNGILNLTALMSDTNENISVDEFVQYSKMLNKAARNIYLLLDNLLEWSQVQKGSIPFNPKIYDLSKMVSQSIDTIYQSALHKKIAIINEINEPQNVYADEKSISTVIRNLLTNAVKFTRMDGRIVIKSRRIDDNTIQVSIQDNGVGISDDNVNKLFKIEEKVSTRGTEGEPSSGLGLLLCKEFVDMHGQNIWAESEINKGSTFSFTLREAK